MLDNADIILAFLVILQLVQPVQLVGKSQVGIGSLQVDLVSLQVDLG
jgi:hypothetical protein